MVVDRTTRNVSGLVAAKIRIATTASSSTPTMIPTTYMVPLRSARGRPPAGCLLKPDLAKAIHGLSGPEIVQLEQLPDFDLPLFTTHCGVGKALGPFERLFSRLDLDQRIARDQLLRLRERPVNDRALVARILDLPAFRAGLKP